MNLKNMKNINKTYYKVSIAKLNSIAEDIKIEMSNNLQLQDKDFILNCTALDTYLKETKESLLKRFKSLPTMQKIVKYSENVLINEVKPNIKYMGHARIR